MASAASPPNLELASPSDEFMNGNSGYGAQLEGSDVNGDSNAGHPRRPAWNRPINGDAEGISVMGGAISWPALSESTRPISRSLSDSTIPVSDGSASPSQAPPLISQPPQVQGNPRNHANSSTNNMSRPKSRNIGTGSSHNTFSRPSSQPFPVLEASFRPIPQMADPGARQGAGSNPRTPSRRGGHNYGARPRRDGAHHNNYGGRRHQERMEVNISHPPYMPMPPPMGYMPPPLPPGVPPFMGPPPPPPMSVFPGQMGFEIASPFMYMPQQLGPESFMALPTVPPPMPMLFRPANENSLTTLIVNQIDYYFSDDNLARDNYLRSKMDDQGWVPITLIASFHRVQQMTKDAQVILDALKHSTIVEVQGEKIRRRATWRKWLHSSNRPSPVTHIAPDDSINSLDVKDAKD